MYNCYFSCNRPRLSMVSSPHLHFMNHTMPRFTHWTIVFKLYRLTNKLSLTPSSPPPPPCPPCTHAPFLLCFRVSTQSVSAISRTCHWISNYMSNCIFTAKSLNFYDTPIVFTISCLFSSNMSIDFTLYVCFIKVSEISQFSKSACFYFCRT